MITIIKRIIGETLNNLKHEKKIFFSTLITMTVIFLILNFVTAYTFNLYKLNEVIKSNLQIKVYVEKGISKDGINELQNKLMNYSEIKGIKYVSKETALAQISKNLNTPIEFADNPLPDVFIINIDEDVNVDALAQKLVQEPGIEEVDKKSEFIMNLNKIINGLNNIVIYVYIIIALPVFIMIFNLIHASVLYRKEDIEIMALVGASKSYIKWPFFLEGAMHVICSTLLSVLIFVPVYNYIKEGIEAVLPFISMISISDMALYLLGGIGAFGLVVTIIASVFSLKFYLKMYGD